MKTVKSEAVTIWTQKNLKKGTPYKYLVKAYQIVNGKKKYIKTSQTIHIVTLGGKNTNVKKLQPSFTTASLKRNNTKKLAVKTYYTESGKKVLPHASTLQYTSTNTKVASVNSKGTIKANAKGTCYIYVTAGSGIYTKVKITVK